MLLLLLIIGTATVLTFFYRHCVQPLKYWKNRGVDQGNPKWLFGHFWGGFTGRHNGTEIFQEVYDQSPNSRYTGLYRFSNPVLVLRDPELIKQITVRDFDSFMDHSEMVPADTDPIWARTLLSLTGSKWKDMRSHLSPSFTSSKMRVMFQQMSLCAEDLVQYLLKENQEVLTVELRDVFSRFTNDVIATTVFGVKVDSLTNPKNEFYEMGNDVANFSSFWKTLKLLGYWLMPPIKKFVKIQFITDEAGSFFQTIVNETVKIREEKSIVRQDMLQLLIEARNEKLKQREKVINDSRTEVLDNENYLRGVPEITNEDITAQALIFFIGGLESVSSSISFTLYELAVNPSIQDRLRLEVRDTLEDCGGKITYEAIFNMKYMEMVVSESMRKWPHFTGLNRVCTKSYTIEPQSAGERPLHIEEGGEVLIPLFAIHHDPKYFPNPERFDPERFSEENKEKIHPYTYFPFGLGPRNCIGSRFTLQEVKIVLFHLLTRFEVVPVEKTAIPLRFSKSTLINLKPVGGFWVGFKKCEE